MSDERAAQTMLLVSETNFLVGHGLAQGPDYDYLASLAIHGRITLAIPEFCFREVRSTLRLNLVETRQALAQTHNLLRQVGRSEYAREAVSRARDALTEVTTLLEERGEVVQRIIDSLEQVCQIIPYTPEIMAQAHLRYVAGAPPRKESDAEVYESVLAFLRDEAGHYDHALFLTLDTEHFDCPEIHQEIQAVGGKLTFSTGQSIAAIRRALGLS